MNCRTGGRSCVEVEVVHAAVAHGVAQLGLVAVDMHARCGELWRRAAVVCVAVAEHDAFGAAQRRRCFEDRLVHPADARVEHGDAALVLDQVDVHHARNSAAHQVNAFSNPLHA